MSRARDNANGAMTGNTIQVVQKVFKDVWSSATGATTFSQITGFEQAITPKYASSKILVSYHMHLSTGYWEIQGRMTRNGSVLTDSLGLTRGSRIPVSFAVNNYEGGTSGNSWNDTFFQFLDSPNTTSTLTYGMQLNAYSTYTVGINRNVYADTDAADYYGQPISTITIMEIAHNG
jgi:hypothetical protein